MVATKSAYHFFDPAEIPVKCYTDEEEWVSKLILISERDSINAVSPIFSSMFCSLAFEVIQTDGSCSVRDPSNGFICLCRLGRRKATPYCTLRWWYTKHCTM